MITNKELWARHGIDTDDTGTQCITRHKFLELQPGEAFTAEKTVTLMDTTELDVADVIAKLLNGAPITGDWPGTYYVHGQVNDCAILVIISSGSRSRGPADFEAYDAETVGTFQVRTIKIEVTGHRVAINEVFSRINNQFSEAKVAMLRWWYKGNHGPALREMFLEPLKTTLHEAYYPGLGNPSDYLKRYLASSQAILLMIGAPGTGKTTLLRHLICDHDLTADIIYDEAIMNNDSVFQNFLFDNKSQVMVIEDADSILSPRDSERNALMSRFLNVSDGIIKLPEKKLVFTTNLSDYTKVDPALLRPGRCFDVLHTRALSYEEACTAAKAAGLPKPEEKREYTTAELWNGKQNVETTKMGF